MKAERIRAGQKAAYMDSVYEWEVTEVGTTPEEELWQWCKEELHWCMHRDDAQDHNGHCGFPHGLMSYGSLIKLGEDKWRYTVTEPYDD